MSFNPENSAIKVDAQLEEALKNASSEQIKTLMAEAAVRQGLATRDIYDPNVLLQVEAGTQLRAYAKTVTVNGVKHIIEGANEQELLANETAFYRAALTPAAPETATETARDSATGRFTSQADADELMRKADLELRFKRGEVSASEYLAQSGAVDEYLASRGVSVDALRQTSEKTYQANWESATETFIARHPEWKGGSENLQRMGTEIAAFGLTDSPSVESLEAAYAKLVRENRIAENPETVMQQKIASARTPEELRAALGRNASSMFGGS